MKKGFACAIGLLALAGGPALAKAPIAPPDFVAAFNAEDTNHDGKLSWDEYLTAAMKRNGAKYGKDALEPTYNWAFHYVERFAQMDLDDDESLSLEEYTRGRLLNNDKDGMPRYIIPKDLPKVVTVVKKQLPLIHPEITESPVSHVDDFYDSDTNHDGKLSFKEFFEGRRKREALDHPAAAGPNYFWYRHFVERFQLMDLNFDGYLTREETLEGRLLNTYNDWTFRFILPKPTQGFPVANK